MRLWKICVLLVHGRMTSEQWLTVSHHYHTLVRGEDLEGD